MPTPRDDYAGTIETIAGLVGEGLERRAGPREGLRGRWRAGRGVSGDRPHEELQQRLAQRPAARRRPRAPARAARCGWPTTPTASRCPRRGTGPGPAPAWSSASSSAPGPAGAAGRWTDGSWTGPERHRRGVGPRTHSRGRATASGRGRRALRAHRVHRDVVPAGPGLARDHGGPAGEATSPPAAARGEPAADASLQARYEERMARALASVINVVGRPRRDGARRGAVEPRPPVRGRSRGSGAPRVFCLRPGGHAPRAARPRGSAAASGARRGCGPRRSRLAFARAVRTASSARTAPPRA